jgi:hypothetical protein
MTEFFRRHHIFFFAVFSLTVISFAGIAPAAMAAVGEQIIVLSATPARPIVGGTFTVPVTYDVYTFGTTPDNTLQGIGVRVFYESSKVQYEDYSNWNPGYQFGTFSSNSADSSDFDGNADTDMYFQYAIFDFFYSFPGVSLPLNNLIELNFTMLELGTSINSDVNETHADYDGVSNNLTFVLFSGDINNDGQVTLADSILALQISVGMIPADIFVSADVNGDGKIGIEEAIYTLEKSAGLRN